jgi:hypothetical protein
MVAELLFSTAYNTYGLVIRIVFHCRSHNRVNQTLNLSPFILYLDNLTILHTRLLIAEETEHISYRLCHDENVI